MVEAMRGGERAADRRGAEHEDVGLVRLDQLHDDAGVGQGGEELQAGIVCDKDIIAAEFVQLRGQAADVAAEQHRLGLDAELLGQLRALADQFERDVRDLAPSCSMKIQTLPIFFLLMGSSILKSQKSKSEVKSGSRCSPVRAGFHFCLLPSGFCLPVLLS